MSSEQRRDELLQMARQSRLKWVLDSRELPKRTLSVQAAREKSTKIVVSDSLKAKIPASECVQNVLNFLSELRDDGECFDVETIAMGIVDYDDFDSDLLKAAAESSNQNDPIVQYNIFIHKLVHPSSTEIVKQIQQFVNKFNSTMREARNDISKRKATQSNGSIDGEESGPNKIAAEIWIFLNHIYEQMHLSPLWASETEAAFELSKAHCEKFVFTKLYSMLFAVDIEDSSMNQRLRERLESLSFITAAHLDIKCLRNSPIYHTHQAQLSSISSSGGKKNPLNNTISHEQIEALILQKPVECLREIETAKCPQDKVLCIKKCTMAIATILKECTKPGTFSGTDEFLPLMILVVKLCNPQQLYSHVKFLKKYMNEKQEITEGGYLRTNFITAVSFLEGVDAEALTIRPEEFERAIAQCRAMAIERNRLQQIAASQYNSRASSNSGDSGDSSSESNETATDSSPSAKEVNVEMLLTEYKKAASSVKRGQFVSIREVAGRRTKG